MLHSIVPGATTIEASVDDTLDDVVSKIPHDAGAFHFHLNCTLTSRFPVSRRALLDHLGDRGIPAINAALTDISKRTIQRRCTELGLNSALAAPEGDPDEIVIVKTDLNFGGDSEWALSGRERAILGIGEGSQIMWKPTDYQVIPRRDVEPHWWIDQSLTCEKYIGNKDNRWYRAAFFFSRLVLRELVSPNPIKKVGQSEIIRTWNLDLAETEPSAAGGYPQQLVGDLIAFIRGFGVDFGTIDIMMNDVGEPFIIDVNTTPSFLLQSPDWFRFMRDALAAPKVA